MVRIEDSLYIQIVRFSFNNAEAQKLNDTVKQHLKNWISACPGFVSANLHVSENGKHMINYAQWHSKEHFEDFLNHPEQEKLLSDIKQVGPINAQADRFYLSSQQSNEDTFWERTHI